MTMSLCLKLLSFKYSSTCVVNFTVESDTYTECFWFKHSTWWHPERSEITENGDRN